MQAVKKMKRFKYILLVLSALCMQALSMSAANVFYRIGRWTDNYLMQGLDTNYIALPEHSWHVSLNSAMVGIHSDYASYNDDLWGTLVLHMRSTPSVELGFNAGYRGFGFGYSWDLLHAYSTNLNISLGSKSMGLEFMRQVSTNLQGSIELQNYPDIDGTLSPGFFWITNTYLSAWYALNSKHYNHNAAIKQSYIQRRTAGSLLLSLSYLSTDLSVHDSVKFDGIPVVSILLDGVTRMVTHQVSVGLGYGINYTPNNGKVVLHAAAFAQLVCFSINQVSVGLPDSLALPAEPYFNIKPHFPVHVTGTIRAAVSWEINKWVHLSAWGQVNNLRFNSSKDELTVLKMSNWNWQAHLTLGVRFGAGKERVRKAFADEPLPQKVTIEVPARKKQLPRWITDYFFSSHLTD